MAAPAVRIANRVIKRVPSPLLRWSLRLAARVLLPLAGAATAAALQRLRDRTGDAGDAGGPGGMGGSERSVRPVRSGRSARSGHRTDPAGTVVVEIDRELDELAPTPENPAEPLAVLARRAYLTLAPVPGRSATCLRAVPKRAGDDVRYDVALAKQQLES
jgi:hypothetical protein